MPKPGMSEINYATIIGKVERSSPEKLGDQDPASMKPTVQIGGQKPSMPSNVDQSTCDPFSPQVTTEKQQTLSAAKTRPQITRKPISETRLIVSHIPSRLNNLVTTNK